MNTANFRKIRQARYMKREKINSFYYEFKKKNRKTSRQTQSFS